MLAENLPKSLISVNQPQFLSLLEKSLKFERCANLPSNGYGEEHLTSLRARCCMG